MEYSMSFGRERSADNFMMDGFPIQPQQSNFSEALRHMKKEARKVASLWSLMDWKNFLLKASPIFFQEQVHFGESD